MLQQAHHQFLVKAPIESGRLRPDWLREARARRCGFGVEASRLSCGCSLKALSPSKSPRQGPHGVATFPERANQVGLRSNLGNLINAASWDIEERPWGGRGSKLAADER